MKYDLEYSVDKEPLLSLFRLNDKLMGLTFYPACITCLPVFIIWGMGTWFSVPPHTHTDKTFLCFTYLTSFSLKLKKIKVSVDYFVKKSPMMIVAPS